MNKIMMTVAVASLASLANAWVIFPGLQQAKTGAWDAESAAGNFDRSAITLECVPGPVMADVQTDEGGAATKVYSSPWTGSSFTWNAQNTTWSYRGEIYLTGGKTYAFGKYLDDGAVVFVNGQTLIDNGGWQDRVTGTFEPQETGWYPFVAHVYDGSGGKGPTGGDWGSEMGLAWNETGKTDGSPAIAGWRTIRDSGDASVLRYCDKSASPVEIVRARPAEGGYELEFRLGLGVVGKASVGLSATAANVPPGESLGTDWEVTSVVFETAGEAKTVFLPWTEDSTPHLAVHVDGRFARCETSVVVGCSTSAPISDYDTTRTIRVDPVEEDGVLSRFEVAVSGGTATSCNSLLMAYGALDGGDVPTNWANLDRIATVRPGEQHFSVAAPAGWGETVFACRFFVTEAEVLPYSHQVEYLKSNGNSTFTDVGYTIGPTSKIVLRFQYAKQSGGLFFGNMKEMDSRGYYFRFFAIPSNVLLDINDEDYGRLWCDPIDPSAVYTFEVGNRYVYNENTVRYWGQEGAMSFDRLEKPATLMTRIDYGSIYSINVRHNDTDGDDYQAIPVVGWNGQTALFDKVSGTIHYSSLEDGYEDFVAGATVAQSPSRDAVNASSSVFKLEALWIEDKPFVTREADDSLVFHAKLDSGVGSVSAVYNGTITQLVAENVRGPQEVSATVAELAADSSYDFAVRAEDAEGNAVEVAGEGVFYTGELTVAKVSDASESDLATPGEFVIARADAHGDLTVNYALGGTAVAGRNYLAAGLTGTVVITNGATSVVLPIYPRMDPLATAETTVVLTLGDGLYGGVGSSATMTIEDLSAPEGYKTWMGTADADGYADMTDPANWSGGELPGKDDVVLLDGRFSRANLVWDAASVPAVAGWTQSGDFTGTIVFDIGYPAGTEPSGDGALEIAGDVTIAGGTWTMSTCADSADTRRLAVRVGGSLTISEGATIDVTLRGAKGGHERAGCHGGDNGAFGKTYGDPKRPFWCGSGNGAEDSRAGGAVWLEVAGAVQLDGSIVANGANGSSGGSVYLKAASLSGSGRILANGNSHGGNGSGGRIAVELTTATLSESFTIPGAFQAYGCSGGASMPGAGTIVVKNPGESNGTLYVCNNPNPAISRWDNTFGSTQDELTTLPAGSEWTFDRVVTGHYGTLAVGTGTTLNLPNGFASLASAGGMDNASSVMLCGGVINAPAVGGVHTFRNGAFFYPASGYAFGTDVVIESGAAIGASYVRRELAEKCCTFAVNGSLTVNEGGSIDVSRGGFGMSPGSYSYTEAGCHGGQAAKYDGNCAYGSVFGPLLSGGTNSGCGDDPQVGAGVLELSVSGALVVDGIVTARGSTSVFFGESSGQAGGSINIVAGSLSGQGEISADGSEGFFADDNLQWNLEYGAGYTRGGGGRIAIRLTDPAATFGTFDTTKITARGWNSNHHIAGDFDKTPLSSSAGTVYLETAKDGDKGGLIRVANRGTVEEADWPHTTTCLPAGTIGDAADDFRHASLAVADAARVKLFADLRMKAVELGSGASLDLNGKCLKVGRAVVGGSKLAPGVYAASELAALVDSSAGADGTLVVTGSGLVVIVK